MAPEWRWCHSERKCRRQAGMGGKSNPGARGTFKWRCYLHTCRARGEEEQVDKYMALGLWNSLMQPVLKKTLESPLD